MGNVVIDKCEKCGARVPDDRELTAVPINPDPAEREANWGGVTVTQYMLLCDQCELEMIGVD